MSRHQTKNTREEHQDNVLRVTAAGTQVQEKQPTAPLTTLPDWRTLPCPLPSVISALGVDTFEFGTSNTAAKAATHKVRC